MAKNKINLRFGILVVIVLLAALSRLIPHWYNFTPIGAMALFGAAYFKRRYWAILVPLAALWISDLFLNNLIYDKFYEGFSWYGSWPVYLAFAGIVGLGWLLLKKVKVGNLLVAALSASALFFLVTNFFVWLGSPMYPQTISGLLACYIAGIPFFWNTLLGDLFYTAVLFGAYEWAKNSSLAGLGEGLKVKGEG